MLNCIDEDAGVELLKRVKAKLKLSGGISQADRNLTALESGKNNGKCTWEAQFKGMEFDFSFAHEGSSNHRGHELLSVLLEKAIEGPDRHDRAALQAFALILKFISFLQATPTKRRGEMKTVHATVLGIEAMKNIQRCGTDDEMSVVIGML